MHPMFFNGHNRHRGEGQMSPKLWFLLALLVLLFVLSRIF